jgi:septal ring factor EnvC (AmiA/AmiB activator)
MNKLWTGLKWIGAALLAVLFAVLGRGAIKANKRAEELEKQVDEQKKKVAQNKIESANLEYDLEKLKNENSTQEKIDSVKEKIITKANEIKDDDAKLKTFTSELDKVKVKGGGSIKKKS